MLVIRLGEIVSMPLAARLARKAVDKRLSDASVTPRVPEVTDDDLEVRSRPTSPRSPCDLHAVSARQR